MVKDDLINELSKVIRLNKDETKAVIESLTAIITGYIVARDKVELRGFGTFYASKRNEKPARVIKTGMTVTVPPRYVPKFVPGTILKKEILETREQKNSPEVVRDVMKDSAPDTNSFN